MSQITFTFEQVLSLLDRQRELALQSSWSLYREAVHVEDGKQLNKWQHQEELEKLLREPEDIAVIKKYMKTESVDIKIDSFLTDKGINECFLNILKSGTNQP
jgi:hypothetical protein